MRFLFLIVIVAALQGCGKKPAATPETAPTQTAAPTPSLAVSTTLPSQSGQDPQIAAMLGELTQVLRKFSAEKQRVPKNLSELVAPGYLSQLPAAPAGQKFAINEKRVEVTLVKQ